NSSLTSRTSSITALTLAGAPNAWIAKLDLNNNNLIVADGTNIPGQLKQGAVLGSWNASSGITSSSAKLAATGSTATALAYATGSQFTSNTGQTTFDSLTFNPTDTLIMYTLAGDANMEGSVTFADFLQLQNHYNQPGTDWQGGDFNYDGSTTFADFLIL